jgi:hypothetical protein
MIVHQNHDYSHLPGGQPHYRLPETFDNVRMAGGKRTIYHLIDADHRQLRDGRIVKAAPGWAKFWREVETFPLNKLHSYGFGQVFYSLFHPQKAYVEWRAWLRSRNSAPSTK